MYWFLRKPLRIYHWPISNCFPLFVHNISLRNSPLNQRPLPFVSTCILSHSGVGAFLWDFTKAFVLYFSFFLAFCLAGVACFLLKFAWCMTSFWDMAIAFLSPLFSWLKGDPPGTYPSSCQQKKLSSLNATYHQGSRSSSVTGDLPSREIHNLNTCFNQEIKDRSWRRRSRNANVFEFHFFFFALLPCAHQGSDGHLNLWLFEFHKRSQS